MILKLTYLNHHGYEDVLEIQYPYIDYRRWLERNVQTQEDIISKLNDLLSNMDCTRDYSTGRPMMTTYANYSMFLEDYFYYLLKLDNQLIYNAYIERLLNNHVRNKTFEYEHPYLDKYSKPKETKAKRKPKIENKYVRRETKDLFTGEIIYFYENPKTGDSIESKDPNLLEELNAPKRKKKEIKTKTTAVPLSAMTFSFAKKK